MKQMSKTILLTLTIFLSGCHTITVVPDPLPLPEKLVIPDSLRIQEAEWACLAGNKEARSACSAYSKLVKRSKLKSARIETLRGIIRSTHPE